MNAHSHSKQTLYVPTQSARKKEVAHAMTHICDPIQELLVTARRNQILDVVTNVFAE
jgi:hypothetical protein